MESGGFYHSVAANPQRFNGLAGGFDDTTAEQGARSSSTPPGLRERPVVDLDDRHQPESVYGIYPKGASWASG